MYVNHEIRLPINLKSTGNRDFNPGALPTGDESTLTVQGYYIVSTEAEIINLEKEHYYVHKGEYTNPYAYGSSEFNAYERGWMQSLKRDDGKLAKASSKPVPATPPLAPASNLYALQKGRHGPRR